MNLSWNASWYPSPQCYYATATKRYTGEDGKRKGKTIMMHRVITNTQGFKHVVDHINHDTLDNRKENLRVTITRKNTKHREKRNSNNKSGYRNVCYNKAFKNTPWQVQLSINGKNTVLKRFSDVHEAGEYAKKMREKYYGEFAGAS